jgi:ketosteroid isomerase-like protein
MAEESTYVDLARRGVDALNRRDLDALAEVCSADFQWFPSMAGTIEGGAYTGREGMDRYVEHYDEAWEEFRVEIDEYRPAGDRVLALGRLWATGRGSGVPVSTPVWAVIELRDGKMSRTRVHLDRAEAFRAAGLEE